MYDVLYLMNLTSCTIFVSSILISLRLEFPWKMVLHHWSDEDCVKILANCKKAITSREEGGKVVIGDIILDPASGPVMFETQLLMDVCMMLMKGGRQRDLNDWRDLILKAGFSDYKVLKNFGARGVLELYP